jgi:hypothetical protein
MSQPSSVNSASAELDAFEAFLGSNPDELIALTETAFGGLLARVDELGFDGDAIQAELVSTGIFDHEVWTRSANLDLAEFLALTPVEYAERFPEQGAPLVAAVLNSIHISEGHEDLNSVAGGTHLSTGAITGISVAGGFIGANLIHRSYRINKIKNEILENAGVGDHYLATYGGGNIKIKKDFLGFYHLDITAGSVSERLKYEWNLSLLGLIHKFRQPNPDPDPENNDCISDAEDDFTTVVDTSRLNSSSFTEELLLDDPVIRSNAERAMIDPEREAEYLFSDLVKVANSGARPKSVEVMLNTKLDTKVDSELLRALSKVPKTDLDGVASEISAKESDLFSDQKAAVYNDLYEVEGSVRSDLSEDLSVAKSDIAGAIDQEVKHDERIIEGEVDQQLVKADQVFTEEADAAVQVVDTKAANTAERVE